MRRALNPAARASSRYSSTTGFTSRGGTLCRSKTSVTGMRTGSSGLLKHLLRGDFETEFGCCQPRHIVDGVGFKQRQFAKFRINEPDVFDAPSRIFLRLAADLPHRIVRGNN